MKHCAWRCVRRVYCKIMCMKLVAKEFLSERLSTTLVLPILLLGALAGCSSDGDKRPEYLDAATVKGLEIPPKLSIPDTQGALRLPEPSQKAKSSKAMQVSSIAPVFKGLELKHDSRLYWLEIDMPVADVWARLPDFLASEGITVDRVEKLLGFIDTTWMNEYKVTYNTEGSSSSWFSGFSPDYKDRFRIRLDALPGTHKTRMFVSHRGLQINVGSDASAWIQRDSEPFLEREILYRFVLFSGISKTGATELLSAYHRYQPRVDRITDTSDEFEVKGDADTIWMRLQIALDRLGVDVVKRDKSSATLSVLVGNLNVDEKPPEDSSGWFGGLFSGKEVIVDENEEYEDNSPVENRQVSKVAPEDRIALQLKQIAGKSSSKIKMSNEDGSALKGKLVWQFRDALLMQLK